MFKNAKVISVLNNKGGVLKTSTLVNIAGVLAKKNNKVLIIDADGQGNSTLSFDLSTKLSYFEEGYNPTVETLKYTIYDLLKMDTEEMKTEVIMEMINKTVITDVFQNHQDALDLNQKKIKVIQNKINFLNRSQRNKTEKNSNVVAKIANFEKEINKILDDSKMIEEKHFHYGSIDILPANSNLQFFERELIKQMKESGKYISNEKLESIIKFLKNNYDYIVIDSPPSLGLIQENIMKATDYLIIPLELEFYAVQGISRVLQVYKELKKENPTLQLKAILPTKIKPNSNLHKQMYQGVKGLLGDEFGNLLIPMNEGINISVKQASTLAFEAKPLVLTD